MTRNRSRFRGRSIFVGLWLATCAISMAHEGPPLPATGVRVEGDLLQLADPARRAIGVVTEKVVLKDLRQVVEANATVEVPWFQQQIVTSLLAGRIEQVFVRPGEAVDVGQELCRLESLELETLQADLLRIARESAFAARQLEDRQKLAAVGGLPAQRLRESQALNQQKTTALAIARQKLHALGLADEVLAQVLSTGKPVRTVSIRSPMRGAISAADVAQGQFVQPAEHLFHVVDLSKVWVFGEMLETDSAQMQVGLPARMTFAALPGREFFGTLHHVDLTVDKAHLTLPVTVELANADGAVRPGLFGRIAVETHVAREAVVCTATALLRGPRGSWVLVHDVGENYQRRHVQTGLRVGADVEVLSGLYPGDRVVTVGNTALASAFHDEAVAPQPHSPAPIASEAWLGETTVAKGEVELPARGKRFATATITGRVTRIAVEHGQRVEAGQVLAEIESLELRTLQLDLLLSRSKLELAQQTLAGLQSLNAEGATAEKDIRQLQTECDTLASTLNSIKDKLALVDFPADEIRRLEQLDLKSLEQQEQITGLFPIRAKAGGWVVDFAVVPGQAVRPNDVLFEIHDLDRMEVQGYVFERDATRLRIGQPVFVTLVAEPSLRIATRVARTAPVLQAAGRVLSVWCDLENPQQKLKEGMRARLVILPEPPTGP